MTEMPQKEMLPKLILPFGQIAVVLSETLPKTQDSFVDIVLKFNRIVKRELKENLLFLDPVGDFPSAVGTESGARRKPCSLLNRFWFCFSAFE